MATINVPINKDTYTLVVTSTDALIQNTSSTSAYLVFDTTTPNPDVQSRHTLAPGQALQITAGVPADSCYARLTAGSGQLAVSE